MTKTKALVLFSGGQDSTTALGWALNRYDHVETIGFNYGQRHKVELECRKTIIKNIVSDFPDWAAKLGPDHRLDMPTLAAISETGMTRDIEIKMNEDGLPNTFVPGRNLLFFTYAAAIAYRRGIESLVGGMCEADFSGYPDCRNETLQALGKSLALGMDKTFKIETPLMFLSKADAWALADDLGGQRFVNLLVHDTHTCYTGERGYIHDWGHGCGACPACDLRAKGYREWAAR